MTRVTQLIIFIVVSTLMGCGGTQKVISTKELKLNNVFLNRKTLNLNESQKLQIHFEPSRPCHAKVKIFNEIGEHVMTLLDKEIKGKEDVEWDGRDITGEAVHTGVFYYLIEIDDGSSKIVYNPYPQTQGRVIDQISTNYDIPKGIIEYNLPQAAMVRVRISIKDGGPIMSTLMDWTPKEAGEHILPWDGKDASGSIDLTNHPNRMMHIFAYSLADNSIIVEGENMPKTLRVGKSWAQNKSSEETFNLTLPTDSYVHAKRDPRHRHAADISITFPEGAIEDGKTYIKGKVPVRVEVAPEDQWFVDNSRYELMFFVDAVAIFEDESAFTPYTFMWDTTAIPDGEHLLTVNLLTYDDQYAVQTKSVQIKR